MHRGYLPIWRKFFEEHPFWREKREYSKAEAWLDILSHTQYSTEPVQRLVNGKVIYQNYGEAIMSTRYCGERWGWHNSRVSRFIDLLKRMEQIEVKIEHKITRIIVKNFKTYDIRQGEEQNANGTQTERKRDTYRTQTEQSKEGKEGSLDLSKDKSAKPPAPPGPPNGGSLSRKKNRHFSKKIPEVNLEAIETACLKLDELSSRNGKSFNGWQFTQKMANAGKHPQAILDAMNGIISLWSDIKDLWAYALKIVATKSGNYNEQDHIKQAEEFKAFIGSGNIKELLSGIGDHPWKG